MMKNKRVKVLVTGVFDLLHREHIIFLRKAKKLGDILIVGVESDKRVKEIKGANRPINDQNKRVERIEFEQIADQVIVLPEQFSTKEDHLEFIKKINPDILAVSSHTAHLDKKEAIMKLVSGRIEIIHDHNPDISTTILLNNSRE
jgi:D-beta-D-heptose 7-phosphate kinase/D-beta-D-heptose 1-phosphate adenosyltransferase